MADSVLIGSEMVPLEATQELRLVRRVQGTIYVNILQQLFRATGLRDGSWHTEERWRDVPIIDDPASN